MKFHHRLHHTFHHSVIIGLILVFLSGCGSKVPEIPALSEDAVILAFGDSLTFGTGASAGESYPAVLENLIGRKVINAGVPGEKSKEALPRLQKLLEQHKPDLLLLCHGGNDILQKTEEEVLIDNMRALVNVAMQKDVPTVLIGVPSPAPVMINGAQLYYKVAKVFKLPYEGRIIAKVLSNPQTKSDLIHPNAAGYRQMAEALQRLLIQTGALPDPE
jgi:lysophospholipase L1-like esterase